MIALTKLKIFMKSKGLLSEMTCIKSGHVNVHVNEVKISGGKSLQFETQVSPKAPRSW